MRETVIAHPAATVVLLRDGTEGCEILLVRRNAKLAFHGGAWVFPGGRVDAQDYAGVTAEDVVEAARYAAIREAREEAGVQIAREHLILMSRWVTPEGLPKRFDTWFFVAPAESDHVEIDGSEIHEHRWMTPAAALAGQASGQLDLPPPTFVTLLELGKFPLACRALQEINEMPTQNFLPRMRMSTDGTPCTVYEGDAAYEGEDLDQPGPRHRLVLAASGWRYEREL